MSFILNKCQLGELESLLRQKESKELAILNATSLPNAQGSSSAPSNVSQQQFEIYTSNDSPTARTLSVSPPHDSFSSAPLAENNISASSVPFGLDIMWPNWPPNLPGPELLRHL
jgi:hypothetical protein